MSCGHETIRARRDEELEFPFAGGNTAIHAAPG
jgi:hypothetical protein